MKRTFQPNRLKRSKKHGFRARMKTKSGRRIIRARRYKGRARLAADWRKLLSESYSTVKAENGFSASYRILKSKDFLKLSFQGKTLRTPALKVQILANKLHHPRLGVTVSKHASKKACIRNSIKRQIRENFRKNKHLLPKTTYAVSEHTFFVLSVFTPKNMTRHFFCIEVADMPRKICV